MILSGLSGGGKTAAAKLFEDLGYTVVDNLPGELLPDLADLVSSDRRRFARVAIVVDVRAGDASVALGGDAWRARGSRHQPRSRLPRGARRRAHPSVQRDPPSSPAGRRARHRHLDRGGATDARTGPCRGRRHRRHVGPVAAPAPRAALRAARDAARGPTSSRSSSSASGSSSASRSRPTSSSTSGSCRTRTTSRSCASTPGLTDAVREYVLGQPLAAPVPRLPVRLPRVRDPGLHRRGQDAPDDRDRLHRRLPPLDRPHRGARGLAARAGPRVRSRSSTASSIGHDRADPR